MSSKEFVYIVKYAATKGILKVSKDLVEETTLSNGETSIYLKHATDDFGTFYSFDLDVDYTHDEERAKNLAFQIIEKKALLLSSQLKRVQQKLELAREGQIKITEF